MQFLKILFWCLLAFIAAVFTIANWAAVPIRLWGGLVADVNLPLLLFVTFMVGFLPTLLYNHAIRWRLRQRLGSCERALAELRTPAVVPSYPAAPPSYGVVPVPPVDASIGQPVAPIVPATPDVAR